MRVGRWLGTFAVLFIMTSAGQLGAQAAPIGGTTIGPVQISALGHPSLCWEAGGNGSSVTLERCDHVLQGQQWSLTPDGVLMNGNGYCLEAIAGRPLFIDFAAQCAGAPSQLWHYRSGHLTSPVSATSATSGTAAGASGTAAGTAAGTGTCAATAGPLVPGAEIVGGTCSRPAIAAGAVSRWSIGYSAVTVTPGHGRGPAGGTFSASFTVANAPSAQAAYGVSVTFTLPPGVSASTLRPTTGSGLRCDGSTLTCTGILPAGASQQITLTGPVPAASRPGDSYPVRVHASVAGTTQRPRTVSTTQRSRNARTTQRPRNTPTTVSLTVTIGPAAPHPRSPLPLIAGAAALLLLAGSLLILITRRTRTRTNPPSGSPSGHRPPSRHRAPAGARAPAITQPLAATRTPLDASGPPHAQVDPFQQHQTPVP